MTLATVFFEKELAYDGSQLSSLFCHRTAGVAGDSLIAFVGPCSVKLDHMVDAEDRRAGATIYSPRMLHFIAEHFGARLEPMVWRQRLFARLVAERLALAARTSVAVRGDDLYLDRGGEKKASISVATVSPVSGLFHFAINVRTEGAPVPAIGLDELGVQVRPFADDVLEAYRRECDDVRLAAATVRWVP